MKCQIYGLQKKNLLSIIFLVSFTPLVGLLLSSNFPSLSSSSIKSTPDQWLDKGEVRILLRNAPTIYFYNNDKQASGYEHDLAVSFVRDFLGLRPVFKLYDTTSQIVQALTENEGDFAAAGLSKTPTREKTFLFGPNYSMVEQKVICHQSVRVRSEYDLIGKSLLIGSDTCYLEMLTSLKGKVPGIKFELSQTQEVEEILQQVAQRKIHCTIADSLIFEMQRTNFPRLEAKFSLGSANLLAWPLPKTNPNLAKKMQEWFAEFSKTSDYEALQDHYFSHTEEFDYYDIIVLKNRIEDRLPRYSDMIKAAAERYSFPPELIAAVSYQESHWNPRNRSKTGVRGFMMLTQNTAKSLGVKNRLDAKQSLNAGVKYLRQIYERIPDYIDDRDRLWFTLASYNMGFGHLKDARHLCLDLGMDPDTWHNVSKVLPLLSQKKYYKKTKYGYARGYEALAYVKRIKTYWSIIEKSRFSYGENAEFRKNS
ncbi:MAG: membrane-bound lytic murein transglycosylase MltF [Oligoflexales bacterium]